MNDTISRTEGVCAYWGAATSTAAAKAPAVSGRASRTCHMQGWRPATTFIQILPTLYCVNVRTTAKSFVSHDSWSLIPVIPVNMHSCQSEKWSWFKNDTDWLIPKNILIQLTIIIVSHWESWRFHHHMIQPTMSSQPHAINAQALQQSLRQLQHQRLVALQRSSSRPRLADPGYGCDVVWPRSYMCNIEKILYTCSGCIGYTTLSEWPRAV